MAAPGGQGARDHLRALGQHANGRTGSHVILAGGNALTGSAEGGAPTLGDGVELGINAVVVGDVRLGDGVIVGAGAVVVDSFDGPVTLVGNPARSVGSTVS